MLNFTRWLAEYCAPFGVRVNAVAPGPVDTEKVGPALRHMNETVDYSPNRMTPLRRLAQPVEHRLGAMGREKTCVRVLGDSGAGYQITVRKQIDHVLQFFTETNWLHELDGADAGSGGFHERREHEGVMQ